MEIKESNRKAEEWNRKAEENVDWPHLMVTLFWVMLLLFMSKCFGFCVGGWP